MNKRFIVTMLTLPLAVSSAFAQDASGVSPVRISGFGTGALTWTNTDQAEFARPNQSHGTAKDPRTGVDSNLGLQASVDVNSWLSATAQGLVRKDAEDDYGAELTWAFAKARISDELSVRVGRMGVPVFMISDYRNVGYANTMLRPPSEMYSQVPFGNLDGIDTTWQRGFGATNVTAQVAFGNNSTKLNGDYDIETKKLVVLNLVAEHGPLTLRVGHAMGKTTLSNASRLNTLVGSLRTAGSPPPTGYGFTQLLALADAIEVKDKKATFTSAGLSLDWNNIVVQTEYAKRKTDAYINDTSSWYFMGGYRIGKFLPYVSHSELKIDSAIANTVPTGCAAAYGPTCGPTMAALSNGVNLLRTSGTGQGEQTTDSVGVRWDFHRSAALKVQVDRVKPVGTGLFVHAKPGFTGPVTVGAVALDFVF